MMRPVEELVLDGNALAGALSQVFVGDATTARITCGGCGQVGMLARARLYRGAADVLRCPECTAVLLTVVTAPGRVYLELTGIQCIELVNH